MTLVEPAGPTFKLVFTLTAVSIVEAVETHSVRSITKSKHLVSANDDEDLRSCQEYINLLALDNNDIPFAITIGIKKFYITWQIINIRSAQ